MLNSSKEILQENIPHSSPSLPPNVETFEEDLLNEIAIGYDLTWREVFLLRAYCAYMFQNKFPIHDQLYIKQTLVKHATITKLLVKTFHALFDPTGDKASDDIEKQIQDHLAKFSEEAADELYVLKKVLELIKCTLRTNYYQKDASGNFKNHVSLKFNTKFIEDAPLPRPFAAIFVYSKNMAGCHLRGGKIARGGLRWSDREDFRMEILALMRAQKMKNTIIVPEGAKGGFLIRNAKANQTQEETQQAGIESYKTLLRGLLDITDNEIDGKVAKPTDVVCRDGDDTYLVVAADKGTANFSDTANKLAKEYGFWLDDAFASGGKTGYSHKEIGITSRSTWVSVLEHFNSLGLDPYKDTFTTIGIGSMAGDVCGNGLLLSKKMKLLAAFSGRWIFIDPDPDLEKSFNERKRLFKLPSSNWIDYDSKLISKGGGVFSKQEKRIPLSPEMKELFNLETDEISAENLMKSILMLDVDLFWNGGIGTYIKTAEETHEQVRDKSNDPLRINAKDLKCKIVAEGGNLGLTQAARVEYALAGGLINTDYIDNSGGVDCSDHEVNLKIALNQAISAKKITEGERNMFLEQLQDDVTRLVLANSEAQNHSLSMATDDSVNSLNRYISLISILKEKVELNPAFEGLPEKDELQKRTQHRLGLVKPELSVLLSYSKRSTYKTLMQADDDFVQTFCESLLFEYFPKKMQDRFREEISNHPLRKEICITKLANDIIDHTGLHFFHLTQLNVGTNPFELAKAYSKTWQKLGMKALWRATSKTLDYKQRIEAFQNLRNNLCDGIMNELY